MTVRLHPSLSAELGKRISDAVHLRMSETSFNSTYEWAHLFVEMMEQEIRNVLSEYKDMLSEEELHELEVDLTRWSAFANRMRWEDDEE